MASLRLLPKIPRQRGTFKYSGNDYLQNTSTLRLVHDRRFHESPRTLKEPSIGSSSPAPKQSQHTENPSLHSFNLLQQIRESRPAVRYTVYAGLGLMATVESTFWFNVLRAKFFPSASEEERQEANEFLESIQDAVKGYREVWMRNYGRYYGAHIWGLGYGGLDGLEDEQ